MFRLLKDLNEHKKSDVGEINYNAPLTITVYYLQ